MTPSFWNAMGPAYKRLPSPVPFLPNVTVDMVGGALLGGVAGVMGVHAVGMGVRFKRRRMIAAHERAAAVPLGPLPPAVGDAGRRSEPAATVGLAPAEHGAADEADGRPDAPVGREGR